MLILIVCSGPDKGVIFEVSQDKPIIIGREAHDVRLNDRKASRKHCELTFENGQWFAEDLGSSHGTFRNHVKIDEKTPLDDGDYLQCGRTVMVASSLTSAHAERLALVGNPLAPKSTGLNRNVLIGAGAAAAILAVAASAFVIVNLGGKLDALEHSIAQQPAASATGDVRLNDEQFNTLTRGQSDALSRMSQVETALGNIVSPDGTVIAQIDPQQFETLTRPAADLSELTQQVRLALNNTAPNTQLLDATVATLENLAELNAAIAIMQSDLGNQTPGQGNEYAQLLQLMQQHQAALAELRTGFTAALADAADPNGESVPVNTLLARLDLLPTLEQFQTIEQSVDNLRQDIANQPRVTPALLALSDRLTTVATQEDLAALRETLSQTQTVVQAEPNASPQMIAGLNRLSTKLDQLTTPDTFNNALANRDLAFEAALSELRNDVQTLVAGSTIDYSRQLAEVTQAQQANAQLLDELRGQLTTLAERDPQAGDTSEIAQRLDNALARLDALPTLEQIDQAIDQRDAATRQMLAQALERLNTLPDPAVAAALNENLQQLAEAQPDTDAIQQTLSAVLARLDERDAWQTQLNTLASQINDRSEQTLAALEQATLDRVTRERLAGLSEAVSNLQSTLPEDQLASLSALTDAIAGLQVQLSDAQLEDTNRRASLDQVLTSLHELRRVLPDAAAPAQAYNQLVAQVEGLRNDQSQTTGLLEELAGVLQQQETLASVRRDLGNVAANGNAASDDWIAQTLIDILERLEEQDTDLNQTREALLAALDTPAGAGNDLQSQRILRAIDELPFEVYEQRMRQILSALEDQTGPSLDDIRAVVQESLAAAPANPNTQASDLTQLQAAFREAFLTGEIVRVTTGETDPVTGQPQPARVLNPADAYRAGYTSWQQWYDADAQQERDQLSRRPGQNSSLDSIAQRAD